MTLDELQILITAETGQLKKELAGVNKDLEGIGEGAKKSSSMFKSSWTAAAAVTTTAIVAAGAMLTKSFVTSASEIQSLRASFESLTGSMEDTDRVMTTLYELGKNTAFNNADIQAAGRSYLAVGVSVDDLGTLLSQTADIAGATGADLGRLTLPLTQALARGKLQTQDFYQILDAGAGALRQPLTELAGEKGFGSLAEAMEKGQITSQDLLTVMGQVTQQGGFAFEGAIKQSLTFSGRMSNLQEAFTNLGLQILGVDAITGTIDPSGPFARMADAVTAATDFLSEHGEMIKQVGTVIGILLTPAIIMLGVQGLIAGANLAAGILLALGPIGLIIAAVAAATFLIVKNWDTIKGAFVAVWEWVKDNWPILLAVITGPTGIAVLMIMKNLDTIKAGFSSALNWIQSIWGGIVGWFGGIVNGIAGYFAGIPGRIADYFRSGYHAVLNINWVQLGIDIVSGIVSGLNPGRIIGKMKDMASSALSAAKDALGIHSPSRVMRDQIGKMMGLGIAEGIDMSARYATDSMKGLSDSLSASMAGPRISAVGNDLITGVSKTESKRPITLQLPDGSMLGSWLIDNINGRSFLANDSVIYS